MTMTAELEVELEGLSDVEATIDFTNPKDFTETLQAHIHNARNSDPTGDHIVLVTGFPNTFFTTEDDERRLIPVSHKALYLRDTQTLLLTMPGGPHELTAMHFNDRLAMKLDVMGCYEEIFNFGQETVSIGSVSKEPDNSWGATRSYATCVLECAVSQSGRSLRCNAKIWLEQEESKVSQVITINVNRRRPEIVFIVWKRRREQLQTRASPLCAVVDQVVHITLQARRPVAEGMLRLSFEEFFERKPQPGTREGDLFFSTRELEAIARKVWGKMEFDME
ncbi:hypothetical protein V496_04064 [Pseudogymnoascus sp. VKM F-4515 (FW-2607)]|nr:hypothetical protein V496_04064 [Pseudogymnoascus sp. VKM F-4515 (FW-2607)]KFY98896.1 hypothetical protein V498_01123 [Pseudogymnoascus sp. VKM F-4517 (FW-2822)]